MSVINHEKIVRDDTHNEDCSEKAYLVQEFPVFIEFKLVLGGDVMEEEVVVVVHG